MTKTAADTPSQGEVERGRRRSSAADGYDAFISYSHSADGTLAPALQAGLHKFAKPWYRLRALRVFRDQASLSADPALWGSIETALERSRAFILLASPLAAQSKWVAREARYWIDHKADDRFLIVLTEGEIAWDDERGDFDWDRTSVLPESLRGAFDQEPRFIDMSWARSAERISLDDHRFRESVAELAAPLHGRAKDELIGEDVRQHRRTVRLAWIVSVLLALLAVAAGAGAWLAVSQRNQARAERDTATSRQLATQAILDRSNRLDRSLLLSVAAANISPTLEAKSALLQSVEHMPELAGFLYQGDAGIDALAVSPNGNTVASASGGEIALWDLRERRRRPASPSHGGGKVTSLAFSPDGASLLSGGEDGRVLFWDVQGGQQRGAPVVHSGPIRQLAVSAQAGVIGARVEESSVVLWDLNSRRQIGELRGADSEGIATFAFGPDGNTMATGGTIETITFWDVQSRQVKGAPIRIPIGDYSQAVSTMDFNGDGTMLATAGGGQGGIDLWNVDRRERAGRLSRHTSPVTSVTFHRNRYGGYLASASTDRTVIVWDIDEKAPRMGPVPGHGIAGAVVVTPDGETLLSASDEGTIAVWKPSAGRGMRLGRGLMGGASEVVTSAAFSPDSNLLASAEFESVSIFDVATGKPVGSPLVPTKNTGVNDVAFAPDGKALATAGDDGRVVLWDVAQRKPRGDPLVHGGGVNGIAFEKQGNRLLAAGDDGKILFWDLQSRRRDGEPLVHGSPVEAIALSPDGRLLASAGTDGTVVLWDVASRRREGQPLGHGAPLRTVAFSPDGALLASGGDDGKAVFWDVSTHRRRGDVPAGGGLAVHDVAFSPDGRTLASAGGTSIILWDVGSRRQLGSPLAGVRDAVTTTAYSPDGRFVAWGSLAVEPTDQLLVLWEADEQVWRERACELAAREMTPEEWERFVGGSRRYDRTCASRP